MSLNKLIKHEENTLKKPKTKELLFIQITGGHGSGKSTIVGEIKKRYGNNITTLGKYSESKTNKGHLTGGMDMLTMTTEERFNVIKKAFLSDKKAIIAEGMFISWYKTFLSRYYELQTEKNRKVYIIYLYCEHEELCNRILKRSSGKEITEKRLKNITSKAKTSKNTFDRLVEKENFVKKCFNYTNYDKFNDVINYIEKILDGD